MSGLKVALETSSGLTSDATKKTILQATAPTNQGLVIEEWGVSFGGDDAVEDPVYVTVEIQSDAGSSGVSKSPVKRNQGDDETIQSSGLEDIDGSTQPTAVATLWNGYVRPDGGMFLQRFPKGEGWRVKGGQRIGITITAQQDNPVAAHIHYDE